MTTKVFARRLTQLEALLSTLPEGEYNHKSWRSCAVGQAIKRRDIFRGLNINYVPDPLSLCSDRFTLQSDDGLTVWGTRIDEAIDAYFGPGAFEAFASGLIVSPGTIFAPTVEDTIKNIQTFRDHCLSLTYNDVRDHDGNSLADDVVRVDI